MSRNTQTEVQVQVQSVKAEQLFGEAAAKAVELKEKASFHEAVKDLAVFMALFFSAVLGRIALQYVPSVEPILPFTVLVGLAFGLKEGFIFGSTAYIVSNFFIWGFQGPWTVFQAIAAGLSSFFALPLRLKKNISYSDFTFFVVASTILFEVIMNLYGSLFGIGLVAGLLMIPLYFIISLPFSVAHISGNVFFSKALMPLVNKLRKQDEVKLYHFRADNSSFSLLKFGK